LLSKPRDPRDRLVAHLCVEQHLHQLQITKIQFLTQSSTSSITDCASPALLRARLSRRRTNWRWDQADAPVNLRCPICCFARRTRMHARPTHRVDDPPPRSRNRTSPGSPTPVRVQPPKKTQERTCTLIPRHPLAHRAVPAQRQQPPRNFPTSCDHASPSDWRTRSSRYRSRHSLVHDWIMPFLDHVPTAPITPSAIAHAAVIEDIHEVSLRRA